MDDQADLPPEERKFGPPISPVRRLVIGFGAIALFVLVLVLAFTSGGGTTPTG